MRLHGNIYEDEHHPEDPKRISAIYKTLLGSACVKKMVRIPAREATREEVLLVHAKEHWDKIISTIGMRWLSSSSFFFQLTRDIGARRLNGSLETAFLVSI
jgi:acetoin utilization deacetylase AcuC-like enzyme